VKPSARQAAVDRVLAEAVQPELPSRDDAVLPAGEIRDRVDGAFAAHIAVEAPGAEIRPQAVARSGSGAKNGVDT
jgi:hypothetical protein